MATEDSGRLSLPSPAIRPSCVLVFLQNRGQQGACNLCVLGPRLGFVFSTWLVHYCQMIPFTVVLLIVMRGPQSGLTD